MGISEKQNHWLPRLLGVGAITLYPFIFYEGVPDERIRRHEMCHVAQVERYGWIRFYVSYLLFYFAYRVQGLGHFDAYYEIPYEAEAFNSEDAPLDHSTG